MVYDKKAVEMYGEDARTNFGRRVNKMIEKPFWEQTYKNEKVSTFAKGPTGDVAEFFSNFNEHSLILEISLLKEQNIIQKQADTIL